MLLMGKRAELLRSVAEVQAKLNFGAHRGQISLFETNIRVVVRALCFPPF